MKGVGIIWSSTWFLDFQNPGGDCQSGTWRHWFPRAPALQWILAMFLPQRLWHWTSVCVTWGWEKKATQCHAWLKTNMPSLPWASASLLEACGLLASETWRPLFAVSCLLLYQPGEAAAVWAPSSHFLRRTVSSPDGQRRPRHCSGSFAQPMK